MVLLRSYSLGMAGIGRIALDCMRCATYEERRSLRASTRSNVSRASCWLSFGSCAKANSIGQRVLLYVDRPIKLEQLHLIRL